VAVTLWISDPGSPSRWSSLFWLVWLFWRSHGRLGRLASSLARSPACLVRPAGSSGLRGLSDLSRLFGSLRSEALEGRRSSALGLLLLLVFSGSLALTGAYWLSGSYSRLLVFWVSGSLAFWLTRQPHSLSGSLVWLTRLAHSSGSLVWLTRLAHSSGSLVWLTRLAHSSGSLAFWLTRFLAHSFSGSLVWLTRLAPSVVGAHSSGSLGRLGRSLACLRRLTLLDLARLAFFGSQSVAHAGSRSWLSKAPDLWLSQVLGLLYRRFSGSGWRFDGLARALWPKLSGSLGSFLGGSLARSSACLGRLGQSSTHPLLARWLRYVALEGCSSVVLGLLLSLGLSGSLGL
jgi:hypothetical protein